jgi:hypothetical protein
MAGGGFWSVFWNWGTNGYTATATGTGPTTATMAFTAGTQHPNAGQDSTGNTAITAGSSFNPGTPGTIVFNVPLSLVGSPPTAGQLTKIHAATYVSHAPGTINTAAIDTAPDAGNGADYFVGQVCSPVIFPESQTTALMGGAGVTGAVIGIVVLRRRRNRRGAEGLSL